MCGKGKTTDTTTEAQDVAVQLTGAQIDAIRRNYVKGDDYPWSEASIHAVIQRIRDILPEPVATVTEGMTFRYQSDPTDTVRRVLATNEYEEALIMTGTSVWSTAVTDFEDLQANAVLVEATA